MRYLNILLACAAEPWALEETKLRAVTQFLLFKAAGGNFTDEDTEARIGTRREQQVARSDGQIAILPVYGVMSQRMNMMDEVSGGTSTQHLAAQFREALADPGVKAIVFDMDTPGGTSTGTQELADEIVQSRGVKPIVAQINSMAASAGYWMAAAADEIVVTPGGQGGSIGVYTIHDDISKMLEMAGIASTVIRNSQSPHKIESNDIEPLTEDIRSRVQQRVDAAAERFINGVATGRGVSVGTVRNRFGQGRMFDAGELVERGMADRVATLPETLERFGLTINPVASTARAGVIARAQARANLEAKLAAGDQLSHRELEEGLRGILGLSRTKAEAAVHLAKVSAQGDPENKTASIVTAADLDSMREKLDGALQILERRA